MKQQQSTLKIVAAVVLATSLIAALTVPQSSGDVVQDAVTAGLIKALLVIVIWLFGR